MKMQNMYEAGVGLAHEANRSRDKIEEHGIATATLSQTEADKATARAITLERLCLKVRPQDFNDCDSTEVYMYAGMAIAEQARFDVLTDKAASLIDAAIAIEEKTSLSKAA